MINKLKRYQIRSQYLPFGCIADFDTLQEASNYIKIRTLESWLEEQTYDDARTKVEYIEECVPVTYIVDSLEDEYPDDE